MTDHFSVEDVARVCHAANRVIQDVQGDPGIEVSPPWGVLDPETRQSIIDGVQGVMAGNMPEESHANWVRFKTEHGWTLGPVKDLDAKTHPLLIPYDELPEAQKVKDRLFGAIVTALS